MNGTSPRPVSLMTRDYWRHPRRVFITSLRTHLGEIPFYNTPTKPQRQDALGKTHKENSIYERINELQRGEGKIIRHGTNIENKRNYVSSMKDRRENPYDYPSREPDLVRRRVEWEKDSRKTQKGWKPSEEWEELEYESHLRVETEGFHGHYLNSLKRLHNINF